MNEFKNTDDFYKNKTPIEVNEVLENKKFDLKALSKPNTWASIGQIALEYICIAATIWLCTTYWSWPLYIISLMFIACRQHALGVIMHDGVHYKIATNKKLNDIITEYIVALPIFTPLLDWRRAHFSHHRNPNSDEDPDWMIKQNNSEWVFPKKKIDFIKLIFKYSFCINLITLPLNKNLNIKQKIKYFIRAFLGTRPSPRLKQEKPLRPKRYNYIINTIFYISLFSSVVYLGIFKEFLMFWIFPLLAWAQFLTRIRSIAEHFGIENDNIYDKSRTMYPTLLDKLFLGASWNINYHLDHHLYPSVPSYRIKKLHSLIKDLPEYRARAHITENGFYGVFKECTV